MRYFILSEFNADEASTAIRLNVISLCRTVLDPLREALGRPIIITSGYRDAARNRRVGGSSTSDHLRGMAADFRVGGLTPARFVPLVRRLVVELGLPFDQLILYPGFVHISYRPDGPNRAMILTR